MRIGVNTGEVVTGSGDSLVTGDAVNVAARLEQAAAPGEVLIGDGHVSPRARRRRGGAAAAARRRRASRQPLTAHRLVAVTGDASFARRLDAPLVGREPRAPAARRTRGNACRSERPVRSSRFSARRASGSRGSSPSSSAASTAPRRPRRVPVVRRRHHLLARRRGREAAARRRSRRPTRRSPRCSARATFRADEIAFAVRKLFEQAAAEHPLIVYFDDVQWGEPTFLDLIEHVTDWSREAPILIVCLARPDLLELRPSWGGGKLNATTVLLEPLTRAETDELIVWLLGDRSSTRRCASASATPQRATRSTSSRCSRWCTRPARTRWSCRRRSRRCSQRGSTGCRRAERARSSAARSRGRCSIAAPCRRSRPTRRGVTANLIGSCARSSCGPTAATLPGDDAFRFRHLLIRDAAYDALPKATRAELHERFAVWMRRARRRSRRARRDPRLPPRAGGALQRRARAAGAGAGGACGGAARCSRDARRCARRRGRRHEAFCSER